MSIFKDCDIRGIYPYELNSDMAYRVGKAVGRLITGQSILVCGDVRLSTPVLKKSLIDGLLEQGAQVLDMGIAPTPVFYFGKNDTGAYAGIMVTASHNPKEYNGFKLIIGNLPVTPDIIKHIEESVSKRSPEKTDNCLTAGQLITVDDIPAKYERTICSMLKPGNLRVVLDCCNGTVCPIAPCLFRKMGYDAVELYCDVDGSFPNHGPNPAVYKNLAALQKKVIETGANLGVAFDGDGDRVVFVDELGNVVVSEQSLVIFAREYLLTPSSVVYDLKSSSIVKREVEKLGSKAIMERSGHTFIKRTFLENDSVLAGEISGHFFFRELGYDDGIYAALKMAEILYSKAEPLSKTVSTIPKTAITPDLRIPWPYNGQARLLAKFDELGKCYTVSYLDGIRIDLGFGWILVRKSVTEQAVTIRMEADTPEMLQKIKSMLLTAIPELRTAHEQLK
jgi:phosphomannomutase/phosphoglucomutase